MKQFVSLLLGLWLATSLTFAQQKEQRVALVIGNSTYKTSPLKNPVNDARDMAASLRSYGFTVIERNNLTVKQIGSTLREFRSKLTPGSVALVFYAGHGLQIKGENYLPAVDADIVGEEDVPNQSLSTRQIMDVLGDAKSRLNLVFLDACRDNPYARSFRSSSRGLGKENAPSGTLISFATRPGSVAGDGDGKNGLYTSVLLQQIKNTDQPIEQVLKRVVTGVKTASRGQQEPWMEGSIEGDFCFGECGKQIVQSAISDERAFWDSIKDSRDANEVRAYLDKFPGGVFAGIARARLVNLDKTANTEYAFKPLPQHSLQPNTQNILGQGALQTYPNKSIKLVVPFAPGGLTDIISRSIAEPLSKVLGQAVVVENIVGGGGVVGTAEIAKAAPDGYVLGIATSSALTSAVINSKTPYDPLLDFTPITNIAATPNVLAVNPNFPAKNYATYFAELKAHPGRYSYATSGSGGTGHLQMVLYTSLAGVFATHIPYRGLAPALQDTVSGYVPMIIDNLPAMMPLFNTNKLVPIVVAAPQRLSQLPNVPTFKELGLEPANRMAFYGIYGPKGLPKEVVEKVNAAVRKALEDPIVKKRIEDTGALIIANTPEQFTEQIRADYAVYKRVVESAKLRLE